MQVSQGHGRELEGPHTSHKFIFKKIWWLCSVRLGNGVTWTLMKKKKTHASDIFQHGTQEIIEIYL